MAVEVLMMRHGETEANVQRILAGREDSPFTVAGKEHPIQVAHHLQEIHLACVYASPMERTRRTADLVLEALGRGRGRGRGRQVPLRLETALAEIDAGDYTGLSFEEVWARLREQLSDLDLFGGFPYPGGESWQEVQRRAVGFVSRLESGHDSGAVLIVTHAGVIAGLVAHVRDEPIEKHIRTRYGHDFLGRLIVEDGAIVDFSRLAGTVDGRF